MRSSWVNTKTLAYLVVGTFLFPAPSAASTVSYLYGLSDFSGTVPYTDVNLYVDTQRDEVYASVSNLISVFNASGMEIFEFGLDPRYGRVFDVAVEESGMILLLTLEQSSSRALPAWSITKCNYRGEPIGQIVVKDLPPAFEDFVPNEMFYRGGEIILASRAQLWAIVVDTSGAFQRAYDLGQLAGIPEDKRPDNDIFGFSVDPQGNMLFTIATMFKAFVVSPDASVKAFGRAGSNPGSFGIAAGIAADGQGNVLVADRLRGVVMVFDRDFQFITEFGPGDDARSHLVRPSGVATGTSGKIYVTQTGDRGVAVFKLNSGDAETESNAVLQPGGGESGNGKRTGNAQIREGTGGSSVPEKSIAPPVEPS